jgi:hypothetical protein
MWFYLIPLAVIIYFGMAFVSGPLYVRATRDRVNDDTFVGYTVAAFAWPVCLPLCGVLTGARLIADLFSNRRSPLVKYMTFLKKYYDQTHRSR